jgi:hypothetical protein
MVVRDTMTADVSYDIDAIVEVGSAIRKDPFGEMTPRHIQNLWNQMDRMARVDTRWTLERGVCRHTTISANIAAWDWLENTAISRCRQIASGISVEGFCWFDSLVHVVSNLVITSTSSYTIYPQQFTPLFVAPYLYQAPKIRRAFFPNELANQIVAVVADILAQWLNFDLNGTSR